MLKLHGLVKRLLMNQELTDLDNKIVEEGSQHEVQSEVNKLRSVETPVDEAEETPVPELNEDQNVLLNSCLN